MKTVFQSILLAIAATAFLYFWFAVGQRSFNLDKWGKEYLQTFAYIGFWISGAGAAIPFVRKAINGK